MKPRLRWTGLVWACPGREVDCWRYWRASYETGMTWGWEGRFYADRCAELLAA